MEKETIYLNIYDTNYPIVVTRRKNQKNTIARYLNGTFFVSTNEKVSEDTIKKVVLNFKKKLKNSQVSDDTNKNGIFFLGNFIPFKDRFIKVFGHNFLFISLDDFYKRIEKYAYDFFLERLRIWEKKMNSTKEHKLKLVYTVSYFGCNYISKNTISLNISLIHYDTKIIDSVIVHELAHDVHHNHSSYFYKCVLSFYPEYFEENSKLSRGIYS